MMKQSLKKGTHTMTKKRPAQGIEHRRLRILPEELYVLLPLLDEHRFSPYARAVIADAVLGAPPDNLSPVPAITSSMEKNTCLAIERELLAKARICAKELGFTLNQFLRSVLFQWKGRESASLRVPADKFLRKVA